MAQFSAEKLAKVNEIIARYPQGKQKSALIPVLHIAQEEFEFLISSVKNISRLLQKMIEYLLKSNIDGIRRKNGPKEP